MRERRETGRYARTASVRDGANLLQQTYNGTQEIALPPWPSIGGFDASRIRTGMPQSNLCSLALSMSLTLTGALTARRAIRAVDRGREHGHIPAASPQRTLHRSITRDFAGGRRDYHRRTCDATQIRSICAVRCRGTVERGTWRRLVARSLCGVG